MRLAAPVAAIVLALVCGGASDGSSPVSGRETTVGRWDVLVDADPVSGRPRALAALSDDSHRWTLMVRCLDGQIGILLRPYDQHDEDQAMIRNYAGTFQADDGNRIRISAQTFSAGGILVPDAVPVLGAMEAGSRLAFWFLPADRTIQLEMAFKAVGTRGALAPVRRACRPAEG